MQDYPEFMDSKWYDEENDLLSDEAPEELQNEYRFFNATNYRTDKKNRKMVAQYTDKEGRQYVINGQGAILYEGVIDEEKYPKGLDI